MPVWLMTAGAVDEIEKLTGVRLAEETLRGYRSRGVGPPYTKIGGAVRYRLSDLRNWVESETRVQTTQPHAIAASGAPALRPLLGSVRPLLALMLLLALMPLLGSVAAARLGEAAMSALDSTVYVPALGRSLPLLISVVDAGELAGLTRRVAYVLAGDGTMPVLRVGSRLRVPTAAWLARLGIDVELTSSRDDLRSGVAS